MGGLAGTTKPEGFRWPVASSVKKRVMAIFAPLALETIRTWPV